MKRFAIFAALSTAFLGASGASAQVATSGYYMPLTLATKAAQVAVQSCAEHGYAVNAFVVDTSGLVSSAAITRPFTPRIRRSGRPTPW
jgi:hypothetical protein